MKPSRKWDEKIQDIEIELSGEEDSNYATCMATLDRNTCNASKWKKIIKSEIGRKVQKVFSKE